MSASLFQCGLRRRAVVFRPHEAVPETLQGLSVPGAGLCGHQVNVMIGATVADPGAEPRVTS